MFLRSHHCHRMLNMNQSERLHEDMNYFAKILCRNTCGYFKEDRFRPPFSFKSAKQKLKLSHLSGGNYLFPVELEMPNTLPGFRHLCFHWKLEKLDSAKITNEGSGSQNKRPINQLLKANHLSNKEKRLILKT